MSNAVTSTGILVQRADYAAPVAIVSSSVASPTLITTSTPHGRTSGNTVTITGHVGSTPAIDGPRVVTVVSPTTFTIPVNVTVAGTGGTVDPISDASFTDVAEITEVDPGGMTRNKIETSTHNEGTESHVLGILRQSDPTLKINYVAADATHIEVLEDITTNRKAYWRVKYPSGKKRTGPGYVQTFKFDAAPVDGKQGASLAITWAGPVVEIAA